MFAPVSTDSAVALLRPLESGAQGGVWSGVWKGVMPVAVKIYSRPIDSGAVLSRGVQSRFCAACLHVTSFRDPQTNLDHTAEVYELALCDVRDLMTSNLDESVAAFVTACVIRAVYAYACAGLVHNDLKPENLLVCSDGIVQLCDGASATTVQEACDGDSPNINSFSAPEHAGLYRCTPDELWASHVYTIGLLAKAMVCGVSKCSNPPSANFTSFVQATMCQEPGARLPIGQLLLHPWLSTLAPDVEAQAPAMVPVFAELLARSPRTKCPPPATTPGAGTPLPLTDAPLESLSPSVFAGDSAASPLGIPRFGDGVDVDVAAAAGVGALFPAPAVAAGMCPAAYLHGSMEPEDALDMSAFAFAAPWAVAALAFPDFEIFQPTPSSCAFHGDADIDTLM